MSPASATAKRPHSLLVAYTYDSTRSTELRRKLRTLQGALPDDLVVYEIAVPGRDKNSEVLKLMLTLRRANPAAFAEIDRALLEGSIALGGAAVLDAILNRMTPDELHEATLEHEAAIDRALASGNQLRADTVSQGMTTMPLVVFANRV